MCVWVCICARVRQVHSVYVCVFCALSHIENWNWKYAQLWPADFFHLLNLQHNCVYVWLCVLLCMCLCVEWYLIILFPLPNQAQNVVQWPAKLSLWCPCQFSVCQLLPIENYVWFAIRIYYLFFDILLRIALRKFANEIDIMNSSKYITREEYLFALCRKFILDTRGESCVGQLLSWAEYEEYRWKHEMEVRPRSETFNYNDRELKQLKASSEGSTWELFYYSVAVIVYTNWLFYADFFNFLSIFADVFCEVSRGLQLY